MEIFTMKKTLIALALASAMGTAAADVTVYGSVEQALTNTDNGTTNSWDVTSDDQYIGVKASEDLGNGLAAFAKISFDVNSEGANSPTTKDSFVGLKGGFGSVQVGRMYGVQQSVGDNLIDIFEGNSIDVTNNGRLTNAVAYTTPNMSGLSGTVGVVIDGAAGEDTSDAVVYAVSYANGPMTAMASYQDDKANNDQTTLYGASVVLGDFTVGGAFETVENNDGTADVDTTSVVATYALGNNTLKVGAQRPDEGNDVNAYEVAHEFSKNTTGYVNYQTSSPVNGSVDTDTFQVGLRMNF